MQHHIGKIGFDITATKGMQPQAADVISRVFHARISRELEELFSSRSFDDALYRFENITLDLGVIAPDALETELPQKLFAALREYIDHALVRLEQQLPGSEELPRKISIAESQLEVLKEYLHRGILPARSATSAQTPVELLTNLLHSDPIGVRELLQSIAPDQEAMRRLLKQFPASLRASLLRLLAQSFETAVAALLTQWEAQLLQMDNKAKYADVSRIKETLHSAVLQYLLQVPLEARSRETMQREVLTHLNASGLWAGVELQSRAAKLTWKPERKKTSPSQPAVFDIALLLDEADWEAAREASLDAQVTALAAFLLHGALPWMSVFPEREQAETTLRRWLQEEPRCWQALYRILQQYAADRTLREALARRLYSNLDEAGLGLLLERTIPGLEGFARTLLLAAERAPRAAWKGIEGEVLCSILFRAPAAEWDAARLLQAFVQELSLRAGCAQNEVVSMLQQVTLRPLAAEASRFLVLQSLLLPGAWAPGNEPAADKIREHKPVLSDAAIWNHFFEKGYFFPEILSDEKAWNDFAVRMMDREPALFLEQLQKHYVSWMDTRLIPALEAGHFIRLMGLAVPEESPVQIWYRRLAQADFRELIPEGMFKIFSLQYALFTRRAAFRPAHYFANLVHFLSASTGRAAGPLAAGIRQRLMENRMADDFSEGAVSKAMTNELSDAHVGAEIREELRSLLYFEKNGIPAGANNPDIADISEAEMKEGIAVHNAGLVLLHPFLSHYFSRLDMLTPKGQFIHPEAAMRSVHLLEYLASRQCETPEHLLALNKTLCGLPLRQAVEAGIEMSQQEIDLSESLLEAVIAQWPAMRNTSPDGLRGSFLLREGILEKQDHWKLRVERKGMDILLEKMPWSYSLIRLKWMGGMIYVEW